MHASVKVASKEYAYGSGAVMSVLRIPLVIITRNAEYIASNLKWCWAGVRHAWTSERPISKCITQNNLA